jgi:succinate dehydrogenase/fumarate reductase flavoprotein subunit
MLYRAGGLRDMEAIQFHPTGLIVPGSVVAGSLLEEGLRGAGAYLLNGEGELHAALLPALAERAARRRQPIGYGNDGRPGLQECTRGHASGRDS